jgi:hypothetical protein
MSVTLKTEIHWVGIKGQVLAWSNFLRSFDSSLTAYKATHPTILFSVGTCLLSRYLETIGGTHTDTYTFLRYYQDCIENDVFSTSYIVAYVGRAVAQAVSRWLPTAAARARIRAACGFFYSGLWGYRHCGHSWPIVPASGDNEDGM